MDSRDFDAALNYLGYVIRRSGQSAEVMAQGMGDCATFHEARYQIELVEALEKIEREQFPALRYGGRGMYRYTGLRDWEKHCLTTRQGGKVVPMKKKAAK